LTEPGGGPAHSAGPPVGDDRRATIAGAVLVGVAVLLGVLLLAKGFSDDGGFLAASTKSTTTTTTHHASSGGATTTTAPIDPATVHIFVANGSGTAQAAAKVAGVLAGKGYPAPGTGNAPTTATTSVFYTAGHAAQAKVVADSLGLPATAVAPMPNPAPVADLGGATVLVVIGSDGALAAVEHGNPTTTASSTTSSTA
jgi:LytR cell envelope-related transcriptional attenuator